MSEFAQTAAMAGFRAFGGAATSMMWGRSGARSEGAEVRSANDVV